MSRVYSERMFEKFLMDREPSAVAFFGEWGVGKTHFWNEMATTKEKNNQFTKYAYVSLFGLDSLASLRTAVYENSVAISNLSEPASGSSVKRNIAKIWDEKAKIIKPIINAGEAYIALGSAYDSVAAAMTTKTIVCIDDFERKSNLLETRDVLGFINFLVERKSCKVILILNESLDATDDYKNFKEKVFNLELKFSPTTQECCEVAIPKGHAQRDKIEECCTALEIKNIRLIRRAIRYIDSLIEEIHNPSDYVINKVIHTLILSVWSIYGNSEDKLDIDLIKNRNSARSFMQSSQDQTEQVGASQAKQRSILSSYKFDYADNLDLELIRYAEDGYPNPDKINEITRELDSKLKSANLEYVFFQIWEDYFKSFEIKEDDIKNRFCEALKAGMGSVPPSRVDEAVLWFREIGSPGLADKYATDFADSLDLETPKISDWHIGRIEDEFLKDKLVSKLLELKVFESMEDIFKRVVFENHWGANTIGSILSISDDSIVNLIFTFKDRRIFDWLETCFSIQFSENDVRSREFQRRIYFATKKVAATSKLNRLKLKRLIENHAELFEEPESFE